MPLELTDFDAAKYMTDDPESQAFLLTDAISTGEPGYIGHALGIIARARGTNWSALARDVGMTREGLYRALSPEGNASFATIAKVAHALGFAIDVRPAA